MNQLVIGFAEPYKSRGKWLNELINEFMIMIAIYHVMCFTLLVPNIDTRILVGHSFITLVLGHTLISLMMIVYS